MSNLPATTEARTVTTIKEGEKETLYDRQTPKRININYCNKEYYYYYYFVIFIYLVFAACCVQNDGFL